MESDESRSNYRQEMPKSTIRIYRKIIHYNPEQNTCPSFPGILTTIIVVEVRFTQFPVSVYSH